MNRNRYLKGISTNILLLGVVSFMNDLSSEMIMPILPMFITVLGGAGLILGLIGGLQDSISSILKVLSGHWSDRIGRRKIFVSSGYLTSASFKLLLSLSMIWQHILVFSSFERVGKGLRTAPRDAIIADSMPEARGKGFGIHRALDTSGAIAGSVIVLLLLLFLCFDFEQIAYQIAFYKSIIFIAAIVAFFSLVPLYFVKEGKREPQEMKLQISLKKLPEHLKLFIAVATLFALANFTYMFFIWKAKDAFMPLMPVKEAIALAILLYVLFNVFYAMLAIPFGTLSDRIGRRKVLTWLLPVFCDLSRICFFRFSRRFFSFVLSLRSGVCDGRRKPKGFCIRLIHRRTKGNRFRYFSYDDRPGSVTRKCNRRALMASDQPRCNLYLWQCSQSHRCYFVPHFQRLF